MAATIIESRALRILVVDDEESIRFALSVCLEADGHHVVAVGTIEAAFEKTGREAFDLIFLDVRLGTQNGLDFIQTFLQESPWVRIVVITAYASIETAVQAIKMGASDYLSKPFETAQLRHLTQKVAERRLLERKVEALQLTLGAMDPESDFTTCSPAWRDSINFAQRVATSNSAVLLSGEAGTGRGKLARTMHEWSPRAQGPFAAVCLTNKTQHEIEQELFGSDPQAGTHAGAVAFCHGGTLLLEEISNLTVGLQLRIATLLQNKEFERGNQCSHRSIDVRIIATTSTDLQSLVNQGTFRPELLMALSIAQVSIPSLRERSEDIPLLAQVFLAYFCREHHRTISSFSTDSLFFLQSHSWPGNVRELRNVIERAVLMCNTQSIEVDNLPVDLVNSVAKSKQQPAVEYNVGDLVALELIVHAHIMKVIAAAKTLTRAASILGVNYSSLSRKMGRLRAELSHDKPAK